MMGVNDLLGGGGHILKLSHHFWVIMYNLFKICASKIQNYPNSTYPQNHHTEQLDAIPAMLLKPALREGQTWVWLRVESWVESESNAFRLSHELILIIKMGKHFDSWINLNQCLDNPLRSWVDSDSIHGKPVESWVESIPVFEILLESLADSNQGTWRMPMKRSSQRNLVKSQNGQRNWLKVPKRSTKPTVDLNHWVMTWLGSIFQIFFSHESIRIKILES